MPFALIALVMLSQSLSAQTNADPAGRTPTADLPSSEPQLQLRHPRYRIQLGDILSISFALSPELNQTVTVQPDGYVNLQSAGSLHVQGMTVPEMVAAVKLAYASILHGPIINVDLKDFQKPFFTVSGQVGKPGQYELRADITVAEAIAVAGGLQSSAKTQVFLFHRASNDWFQVEKIDLKNILNGKKANEDSLIKPGDMVFVPESAITKFRKYVPYGLNAGSYLAENP